MPPSIPDVHSHGEYKRSQRAKARGIRRALHQRALNVRAWLLRALRAEVAGDRELAAHLRQHAHMVENTPPM